MFCSRSECRSVLKDLPPGDSRTERIARSHIEENKMMRSTVLLLVLLGTTVAFTPPLPVRSTSVLSAYGQADEGKLDWKKGIANTLFLPLVLSCASAAWAISGGGLDYANLDITGQDFSNSNYKGKDFSQVIAKGTKFMNSNLQGCRFYKSYLVNSDFSGADIRGAALEDTSMDGALLKNTNAAGAYFSASILDARDLTGADFSDAQFPLKTLPLLCERTDLDATNPSTGVQTRESLMCP